jgi:chaperonin GroES
MRTGSDMHRGGKQLIVVGDRVLISPDEGEQKTRVGLYLPKGVVEKESVQGGKVVAVGPGTPLAEPASLDDEPWRTSSSQVRHLPMQAEVGDFALFLRKAAVEMSFEHEKYLIVPQAAILVLIRDDTADSLLDKDTG